MLEKIKSNNNYILYGASILVARGAEFLILLYAAKVVNKEVYGELEFYKKIIETVSFVYAFGFPTLLMTYTRGKDNKTYFFFISTLFIVLLGILSAVFLIPFNWGFLIIPFVFNAIFIQDGTLPVFILINSNSNKASFYKTISSILFYLVIALLFYFGIFEQSFVYVNYILFPFGVIYLFILFKNSNIKLRMLKQYWNLFKKLLLNSLTLVFSRFSNVLFVYSDILIISLFSSKAFNDIADYSFPLNVANAVLIVPMTIIQVEIENIKKSEAKSLLAEKKIFKFCILALLGITVVYFVLIFTFFEKFNNTILLFLVIVVAKFFQSLTVLYGTKIIIYKKYYKNLIINISTLTLNIVLSIILFLFIGIIGVAIASLLSLYVRFIILKKSTKKLTQNHV